MKKTYGFLTGKPVTGDQLIGRDLILDQIEKLVLSGQSVVLTDPLLKYWIKRTILGMDKTECV